MTIAACYLSREGIVLGADSTTTVLVHNPNPNATGAEHHFNFAQKTFQIGVDSNLGIVGWGLGSLPDTSYRTLIARLGDQLESGAPQSMNQIANIWNQIFWSAYSTELAPILAQFQQLLAKASRTPEEEKLLNLIRQNTSGGFCLGGYCLPDRTPFAYEFNFGPEQTAPQPPQAVPLGNTKFWGCPNLIYRLIFGVDVGLLGDIQNSGKWTGSVTDLINLAGNYRLAQPIDLPIREAIDWVHSSIYTTIQAMKFSHMAPVCGGAVEIAVITTDRPFRWVRHKRLDAALNHGGSTHEY